MENIKQNRNEIKEKGDVTGGVIPYKNPPALIAYYLSLFSIIPFLGILLGIVAFILGIIGLIKKKEKPIIKGGVHAWIGIILGFFFAMLWLLIIGFMIIVFNIS